MDEKLIDNIWLILNNAIQEIQKKNTSELSFEELYRNAYTMVFLKRGDQLYTGMKDSIINHLENKVREDILRSINNNFLQVLNVAWNDHQTATVKIRNIFLYMDKVYVKKNNVEDICTLGTILFRDLIIRYSSIHDHLRMTMVNLVKLYRNGRVVDQIAIKNTCQMLRVSGRTAYEEDFENPFLKQSAEFYKIEIQKLLNTNNMYIYVKKVLIIIMRELDLVKHCLLESTGNQVIKIIEEELIGKNMKAIVEDENSGVLHMLKENKIDDLASMYKLLTCVKDGSNTLLNCVNQFLSELGKSIIPEDTNPNVFNYIQRLLDLKDRFNNFLVHCFYNDEMFKRMINTNFDYFVNKNDESPEHLSLFIDDKLKKGVRGLPENDRELLLDKLIIIFRFLQEKDVFEKYYKQHLAKRLLLNKSVSNDKEKYMISKLTTECGYQFTSKLEGMLKDMSISNIIMEEFKEYAIKSENHYLNDLDITVKILTTGCWPIHTLPNCNIPLVPRRAFEEFRLFYLSKHNGRKLTLQPQLGSVELSAMFYGARRSDTNLLTSVSSTAISPYQKIERKYNIQVTTYQMCVLLLFNTHEKMTYEDILSETDIPEEYLIRALQSLFTGKNSQRVLLKNPNCREIKMTHEFCVNESYSSELHRVKFKRVEVKSQTESRSQVDEDRKFEIDAVIMRVMKSRKTMIHHTLISEVMDLLKMRFAPSPIMIKKRVEGLIERERISRSQINKNICLYLYKK